MRKQVMESGQETGKSQQEVHENMSSHNFNLIPQWATDFKLYLRVSLILVVNFYSRQLLATIYIGKWE